MPPLIRLVCWPLCMNHERWESMYMHHDLESLPARRREVSDGREGRDESYQACFLWEHRNERCQRLDRACRRSAGWWSPSSARLDEIRASPALHAPASWDRWWNRSRSDSHGRQTMDSIGIVYPDGRCEDWMWTSRLWNVHRDKNIRSDLLTYRKRHGALCIRCRHFHLLDCTLSLLLHTHWMEEGHQLHTLFQSHHRLPAHQSR